MKFYPHEKKKGGGGAEQVSAMLKWGHKKFPPFKREGAQKDYTLSCGGWGRKQFWTRDFPIV